MSYCTRDEVNNLFGDISDDVSENMLYTVIDNATAWIDSNLQKNYIPIPEITDSRKEHHSKVEYNLINVPSGLRTAAIYYAASDILLSLYHGDDLPVQYDVWFNKAQSLLEDYIEAYLNMDAEEEDLLAHQSVKHSKSPTYNQRRRRCSLWER